jgi:hypothetical protein
MKKPYIIKHGNFYLFNYNKHLLNIPSVNAWIFFVIGCKYHSLTIFKEHSNQLMEYVTNENNG